MKIISGGQTGADRAFLEIAKELGFPTGGYICKDYKTEVGSDYSLRDDFGLEEIDSSQYAVRTKMNVRFSDVTIWLGKTGSAGFACTQKACHQAKKPFLICPEEDAILDWITHRKPNIINGSGNRLSHNPGIIEEVRRVFFPVLATVRETLLLEALRKMEGVVVDVPPSNGDGE